MANYPQPLQLSLLFIGRTFPNCIPPPHLMSLHTACLPMIPHPLLPHPPCSADVSTMASGRWKLWKPPDWPCRRKRQTKGEQRVVWSLLRGRRESKRDGRDWGSCRAGAQLLPGGLAEGFRAREERSVLWRASEGRKERKRSIALPSVAGSTNWQNSVVATFSIQGGDEFVSSPLTLLLVGIQRERLHHAPRKESSNND